MHLHSNLATMAIRYLVWYLIESECFPWPWPKLPVVWLLPNIPAWVPNFQSPCSRSYSCWPRFQPFPPSVRVKCSIVRSLGGFRELSKVKEVGYEPSEKNGRGEGAKD